MIDMKWLEYYWLGVFLSKMLKSQNDEVALVWRDILENKESLIYWRKWNCKIGKRLLMVLCSFFKALIIELSFPAILYIILLLLSK